MNTDRAVWSGIRPSDAILVNTYTLPSPSNSNISATMPCSSIASPDLTAFRPRVLRFAVLTTPGSRQILPLNNNHLCHHRRIPGVFHPSQFNFILIYSCILVFLLYTRSRLLSWSSSNFLILVVRPLATSLNLCTPLVEPSIFSSTAVLF